MPERSFPYDLDVARSAVMPVLEGQDSCRSLRHWCPRDFVEKLLSVMVVELHDDGVSTGHGRLNEPEIDGVA
jgi:hypothetical protein